MMRNSEHLNIEEENHFNKRQINRQCLNHSWYEWLTLFSGLFVPLIVAILTIVLPLQQQNLSERQNENSKSISLNNYFQNLELLREQQKQIILNTYEQDLSMYLLKHKSFIDEYNQTSFQDQFDFEKFIIEDDDYEKDKRILFLIRIKTLHALRQLDLERKFLLVQLLIDTGLLDHLNISHLDFSSFIFPLYSNYDYLKFSNKIARNLTLKYVSLYRSNFSYSNLDQTTFEYSNCSNADFSYASLQFTNWENADLTETNFNYSNLYKAKITKKQLSMIKNIHGAILPDQFS